MLATGPVNPRRLAIPPAQVSSDHRELKAFPDDDRDTDFTNSDCLADFTSSDCLAEFSSSASSDAEESGHVSASCSAKSSPVVPQQPPRPSGSEELLDRYIRGAAEDEDTGNLFDVDPNEGKKIGQALLMMLSTTEGSLAPPPLPEAPPRPTISISTDAPPGRVKLRSDSKPWTPGAASAVAPSFNGQPFATKAPIWAPVPNVCWDFQQKGWCSRGRWCRWFHPTTTSATAADVPWASSEERDHMHRVL